MKNLARRVVFSLATFIALAVVSFVGVDALPGDGCTALLGRFGTDAKIDACRKENNLNDSVVVRLKDWSGDLVRGDLGYSIKRDEQVSEIIIPRLRNTAVMAAVAALIAFPSAIVVGLLLGRYPRKRISKAVNQFSVIAMTLPEFVIATVLWLVLSIWIPIFPGVSVMPSNASLLQLLPNVWLPALTLAVVIFAHSMRTMRASVTNVQNMPFVESARLRGTNERKMIKRHIVPAALPPVVNVVALDGAWLLTGTFVTEAAFNFQGLGRLAIDAISDRDTALILPIILFGLAVYLVSSILADSLVRVFDPRLRLSNR
ncbi:MAG: ABC transporter permease [Acidimicrobiaceae bacterium]|nr:ABC transporter permease [Acidimicrobiaceae bacterium]